MFDEPRTSTATGMATGQSGAVVPTRSTTRLLINVQVSYDEGDNFAAVANVEYELVPGFRITPEVVYTDNFEDDDDDDDGDEWGGFLRFQRNF